MWRLRLRRPPILLRRVWRRTRERLDDVLERIVGRERARDVGMDPRSREAQLRSRVAPGSVRAIRVEIRLHPRRLNLLGILGCGGECGTEHRREANCASVESPQYESVATARLADRRMNVSKLCRYRTIRAHTVCIFTRPTYIYAQGGGSAYKPH